MKIALVTMFAVMAVSVPSSHADIWDHQGPFSWALTDKPDHQGPFSWGSTEAPALPDDSTGDSTRQIGPGAKNNHMRRSKAPSTPEPFTNTPGNDANPDDWADKLPSTKPDDSGNDAENGGGGGKPVQPGTGKNNNGNHLRTRKPQPTGPITPDNGGNGGNNGNGGDRTQKRTKQPITPMPSDNSIDKGSKKPDTPAPSTSGGGSGKGGGSGWEAQMLEAVNNERSKQGLKPLCINSKLTKAAADHAADMASKKYFDHNSQDGRSAFDRIKAAGFKDATAAENIAQGQRDVADVMKTWMNSEGHRKNIMGQNYAMVGFGMTSNYWVQDFGGSQGEQCG